MSKINQITKLQKEVRGMKEVLTSLKLLALDWVEEVVEIRTHPKLSTACWRWDEKKHKILIGLGNGLEEKFKRFPRYCWSFGIHELGHAIWTVKDLSAVQSYAKELGVPVKLVNLFEDARIEELIRKKGERFEWERYEYEEVEKLKKDLRSSIALSRIRRWEETYEPCPEEAVNLFFLLIQTEGNAKALSTLFKEVGRKFFRRVLEFYRTAVRAKDTYEIVRIAKEFTEEFGKPEEHEVPSHSLVVVGGEEVEEFEALWEEAGRDEEDGGERHGERGDRDYEGSSGSIQLSDEATKVDWTEVKREVRKLLNAFRSKEQKEDGTIPAKRINPKKLSLDREDIYRRRERKSFSMRPFTLFVDCSGSMRAMVPHQHHLTAVFSELVRETGAEGYLILTKNHQAQLFKLPVDRDLIERIPYNGGSENIVGGLVRFWDYVLKTKYVFIISDMQITDYWNDTEKKIKELRNRGIEVIGIYRGRYYDEARENAQHFFDKFVVTETSNPIDLLIPLLKRLKR